MSILRRSQENTFLTLKLESSCDLSELLQILLNWAYAISFFEVSHVVFRGSDRERGTGS